MRKSAPLDFILAFFAGIALILSATNARAQANKLELAAGYYQLTSDGTGRSSSLANFGTYRALYHHGVFANLEVVLGYSLFVSDVISGDMGFGPDLGLMYFPFSHSSDVRLSTDSVSFSFSEKWRPFGALTFHQRSFQSVDSTFAGFGAALGTEYDGGSVLDYKLELRYLSLGGPSSSSATQIEAFLGVILPL